MPAILADHNAEGHLAVLLAIWTSSEWREFWSELHCSVETFASLGISRETLDSDLWQLCQDRQLVLLTGNRNEDGPDSLEATIQSRNQQDSLPVFTIGDPDRVITDRPYAEAVAMQIVEFLLDLDNLRGTRRLFVP